MGWNYGWNPRDYFSLVRTRALYMLEQERWEIKETPGMMPFAAAVLSSAIATRAFINKWSNSLIARILAIQRQFVNSKAQKTKQGIITLHYIKSLHCLLQCYLYNDSELYTSLSPVCSNVCSAVYSCV